MVCSPACAPEDQTEFPPELSFQLNLKTAGNPSETIELTPQEYWERFLLTGGKALPVEISVRITEQAETLKILSVSILALEDVNLNLKGVLRVEGTAYEEAFFYLPGFWYRKNLRSPDGAPSMRSGRAWNVREDRLSVPMAGVYNNQTGRGVTVVRTDSIAKDALMPYKKGEIILHERTDVGSAGFDADGEEVMLTFGYPYSETPKTYIRKLTPDLATMAFQHMEAGEERVLNWEIRYSEPGNYSDFIRETWNYSYDLFSPEEVEEQRSDDEIKHVLTQFFVQSYTDAYELKGFSGVHLDIGACEKRGILETGFVGRVLLNAFNALEYGYETGDVVMSNMANQIFESYQNYGFTKGGFIREVVDFPGNYETDVYSIRRQSEGLYAILHYLNLEKTRKGEHPGMTDRARILLDNLVSLQENNIFPRKFNEQKQVIDSAGGSTSTAIIPLLMGWKYFDDPKYLESAKNAAVYVENEIINKGDYFSSTLDANCEDKEASIYASSAMYYLGLVSEGEERAHYFRLAEKAAYFALSWYYLYDVPFAPGQLLGDLDFKTRGWGNVSVENNHVDVYIFDFAEVLKRLSEISGNERLREMAGVIRSSMREQLLPVEGRMCGIGKVGYYPEVVQHTNWDYGQYGKGYYNDIFAPGWVVASLWELLSEGRLHDFFIQ
ncbi:MAG: hypothetical protein JXR52_08730 [Bacteroidales bacterium]|nr:hypothetical protein [Bacteroidales bacterium]MBN2698897.1 hypothetical protein [Bacteroidales bacterium]